MLFFNLLAPTGPILQNSLDWQIYMKKILNIDAEWLQKVTSQIDYMWLMVCKIFHGWPIFKNAFADLNTRQLKRRK